MVKRRKRRQIFRAGQLHVNDRLCDTCIYRPETYMQNAREQMEQEANQHDGAIVCHETMDTKAPTVCRGYYQVAQGLTIRLINAYGVISFDPLPEKKP